MRYAQLGILFVITVIVLMGCKKTPTDSGDSENPHVAGTFVGWGRPGGTGYNMRMVISEEDSAQWEGIVEYAGSDVPMTITNVTTDEDSVRFEFTRGSTYRCLGVVSNVAMMIYVLEPAGQPNYTLSKVRGAYNLSGDWNGWMYSQFLNTTQNADLFIMQEGNLYTGSVESQFGFYTLLGDVTGGAQDGTGISIWGTAPYEGQEYPFRLDGRYINPDSVNGTWQLDVTGGGDTGTFAFSRRF